MKSLILKLNYDLVAHPNTQTLPISPPAMVQRCVTSVQAARDDGRTRLFVNLIVPLLPTAKPSDIDPWPGGLKQQFATVEGLTKNILGGVAGSDAGKCSTQVLSDDDACAFVLQEGATSAEDCAAIIFPSVDQPEDLQRIDKMVRSPLLYELTSSSRIPIHTNTSSIDSIMF